MSIEGTPTREFPYGKPPTYEPWIGIFCHNDDHRDKVIKAFPIQGAFYTLFSAMHAGRRFKKVIIFRPHNDTMQTQEQLNRIIQAMVPGYQEEVYVI